MKDALGTASWRIRPDLKSEPSSEEFDELKSHLFLVHCCV